MKKTILASLLSAFVAGNVMALTATSTPEQIPQGSLSTLSSSVIDLPAITLDLEKTVSGASLTESQLLYIKYTVTNGTVFKHSTDFNLGVMNTDGNGTSVFITEATENHEFTQINPADLKYTAAGVTDGNSGDFSSLTEVMPDLNDFSYQDNNFITASGNNNFDYHQSKAEHFANYAINENALDGSTEIILNKAPLDTATGLNADTGATYIGSATNIAKAEDTDNQWNKLFADGDKITIDNLQARIPYNQTTGTIGTDITVKIEVGYATDEKGTGFISLASTSVKVAKITEQLSMANRENDNSDDFDATIDVSDNFETFTGATDNTLDSAKFTYKDLLGSKTDYTSATVTLHGDFSAFGDTAAEIAKVVTLAENEAPNVGTPSLNSDNDLVWTVSGLKSDDLKDGTTFTFTITPPTTDDENDETPAVSMDAQSFSYSFVTGAKIVADNVAIGSWSLNGKSSVIPQIYTDSAKWSYAVDVINNSTVDGDVSVVVYHDGVTEDRYTFDTVSAKETTTSLTKEFKDYLKTLTLTNNKISAEFTVNAPAGTNKEDVQVQVVNYSKSSKDRITYAK